MKKNQNSPIAPSLSDYIFGYIKCNTGSERVFAINKLLEKKIHFKADSDGMVIIPLELSTIPKRLSKLLNLPESSIRVGGLPLLLWRYKCRPGLILGFAFIIFLCLYASGFVWDIEVSGNEKISDAQIIGVLERAGCSVGSRKADIDLDRLNDAVLDNEDGIGWLSVNFRGTVAFVEVIEYEKPKSEQTSFPCNLIASRDGVIRELDVSEGEPAVECGESVKRGDLLVSGIIDSRRSGYVTVCARGSVVAEVLDEFEVCIPLERAYKCYTGRSFSDKTLIFFGKPFKISKNSGKISYEYDIINNESGKDVNARGYETTQGEIKIELFDMLALPITLSYTNYNEYTSETERISISKAKQLAESELEHRLAELASAGDVTEKKFEVFENENEYVIKAAVYHTENIALSRQLSVK